MTAPGGSQHWYGRTPGGSFAAWLARPRGGDRQLMRADVLGMAGVAVTVLLADGDQEVVWRTDGVSARLDDLQFTLGEGPTVDAAESGELILEPDLAEVPWQRWPVFTPAALEIGVQAVFAVLLRIGAIRLGVLLAHRDVPGPMGAGVLADMLVFADA